MRLSTKEASVLACVELRGNLTIAQIRKETGYRDHTIRYALSSLEDRGVIRRRPFIDLCALGYTMHNIFFSLGAQARSLKKKLVDDLKARGNVLWLAEMGGDFQYAVDIATYQIYEVKQLLHEISEKFDNPFFEKAVSSQFSASLMPRGYLSSKSKKSKPLSIRSSASVSGIDQLDHKILTALSEHGNLSKRQIALKLQIPTSTLDLRVKKLTEAGVIKGYYYGVDSEQYNYQTFKLIVYARGVDPKITKGLWDFCVNHSQVISFYECFGAWDFEIGVEVSSARDVVPITQEIYEAVGYGINTIKVLSKFRDLKVLQYPQEK